MKTIIALTILLSLAACTTTQKIKLWEAIEQATRDDKPAPPPVVEPTPAPPVVDPPAPCRTWDAPPTNLRGGGVWKPVSEKGPLVILINTRFRTHVTRLALYRAETNELIEVGRFDGDTHNGCRPHYRFAHPGAHYGADIVIRVTVRDGTWMDQHIPDGARRYDW